MSELPAAQKNRLEAWAANAISLGWLSDDATQALDLADKANPGQLFNGPNRPLVAGLFGGTGVGKSTLLNRLAGEPVARASAERPTSRDITLYVHQSVSVERLAEKLPMARMRTAIHSNHDYREVMFVDMPDFDSVEQANRELVDVWLPHLDVVMYVVNPERYRDDMGWQLMQHHAREHAWIFIMNQWDRGDPSQRQDFVAQLSAQGLPDPVVFCTDCAKPAHAPGNALEEANDDFPALHQMLLDLSDQQIVQSLQDHGVLARLKAFKQLGDTWLEPLSDDKTLSVIGSQWLSYCKKQHPAIIDALQWPVRQLAQRHTQTTPFWKRLLARKSRFQSSDPDSLNKLTASLNERLEALADQYLLQQAHASSLPLKAMHLAVSVPNQQALQSNEQILSDALHQALLHPGKPWQRKLCSLLNAMALLLPLAALGWISFRIVQAFSDGGSNSGAYLGSSFAINGALLLGIAWLLPALAHTMLNPSPEQAAAQGLEHGIQDVLEQNQQQVNQNLDSIVEQTTQLRSQYRQLWAELPDADITALPDSVRRLLTERIAQPLSRELDVRANTHNSTDAAPLS